MQIEVVYVSEDRQFLKQLEVADQASVKEGLLSSGVLKEFPQLKLESLSVGIFSKPVTLEVILKKGDRIEIYRPLLVDPKEARRLRAEVKKKRKT